MAEITSLSCRTFLVTVFYYAISVYGIIHTELMWITEMEEQVEIIESGYSKRYHTMIYY